MELWESLAFLRGSPRGLTEFVRGGGQSAARRQRRDDERA